MVKAGDKAKFGKKLDEHIDKKRKPADELPGNVISPDTTEKKTRHRRTRAEIDAARPNVVFAETADPLILSGVKAVFSLWENSIVTKIPYAEFVEAATVGMHAADTETQSIALPITQLKNYYFPKFNPIFLIWGNLVSALWAVAGTRVQLIRTLKASCDVKYKAEHPEEKFDFCKCPKPVDDISKPGVCMMCKKPINKGKK